LKYFSVKFYDYYRNKEIKYFLQVNLSNHCTERCILKIPELPELVVGACIITGKLSGAVNRDEEVVE